MKEINTNLHEDLEYKHSSEKKEPLIDVKEKIEIEKRINEMFGDLLGKTFKIGTKIPFFYKAPNLTKKIEYEFDTKTNEVIYEGKRYIIKPFEGLVISTVSFTDTEIQILGEMGNFEGKLNSTYEETLVAMDQIYKYINQKK